MFDANLESGPSGEIHHVEHQNHGATEIENLVNEIEVSLEIGGVDDAEDAIGLRGIGAATEEHVASHGFIGRTSRE